MKMVEEVFQTDSDRQQDKGTMCQNYRFGFSKFFFLRIQFDVG